MNTDLLPGVNIIPLPSFTTCIANSAFLCSFRKTPKVMSCFIYFSTHLLESVGLGQNLRHVDSRYSPALAESECMELDFCPHLYSDSWSFVLVPVVFPQLRTQMSEVYHG